MNFSRTSEKSVARNTMMALNREVQKLQRAKSKAKKDRMRIRYNSEFGIRVSDKTAFFKKSE